jgi:small-conductance mechanosensitive channel
MMDAVQVLINNFVQFLPKLVPLLSVLALIALAFFIMARGGGEKVTEGNRYRRQWLQVVVVIISLCAVILCLPITAQTQGQLLTLLGLLLTAVITLSSTTVATNAMAGVMIRSLDNFKPGDFIQIGKHFGRVTERDLFHVEIQTEDRDLLTLPNAYVAANPVKVVRATGTVVTAEVTLGYDLDHQHIETLLKQAASDAGLDEPFVYIMDLGDFSVCYRVAGFLKEVRQLLSARSKLRRHMLDSLHGAGLEIVSPNFMNQRQLDSSHVIPTPRYGPAMKDEAEPEAMVFDKAEKAQEIQELKDSYDEMKQELAELQASGGDEAKQSIGRKQRRLKAIKRTIQYLEKKVDI